jgi:hypothetical protein
MDKMGVENLVSLSLEYFDSVLHVLCIIKLNCTGLLPIPIDKGSILFNC